MSEAKRNYSYELEQIIGNISPDNPPTLLLHSCCAPCSSYVLEYLSEYFRITVLYYNPNIYPAEEYEHRIAEQRRFIGEIRTKYPVEFIGREHFPERFYEAVKGLEAIPEGGERCFACYRMRLEEAAKTASENGFDFFTTTLSISPHKNAFMLNKIGEELAENYGVRHLPSDFKKKNGYKRSTELSAQYGIYRQNYCGCVFSLKETEERRKAKENDT